MAERRASKSEMPFSSPRTDSADRGLAGIASIPKILYES
jgi:hypothetical protein